MTCGRRAEIELHHPAGRSNHPEIVVPVCIRPCHDTLTRWQYAAGIELRADVDVTRGDKDRALLVGTMHLLLLISLRQPETALVPGWLIRLITRAMSLLIDEQLPPGRPGRWFPDATVPPLAVAEARFDVETQAERFREFALFAAQVIPVMAPQRTTWAPILHALADEPVWVIEAVNRIAATEGRTRDGSLDWLRVFGTAMHRIVVVVLGTGAGEERDQRALDDAWQLIDSVDYVLSAHVGRIRLDRLHEVAARSKAALDGEAR